MRTNVLILVFDALLLVSGLAVEELLPKFWGIGFPVLLASAAVVSPRRPMVQGAFFALAAGGLEDAASILPMMLSPSYFLILVLLARWPRLPRALALLIYPGYQLWLQIWTVGIGGEVFARILAASALGAVTLAALAWLVPWLERKAALDEG